MLRRHVLYLVNVLVDAFENAIGRIVAMKDSLCLIRGWRAVTRVLLGFLEQVNRLLRAGERYLEEVGKKLKYRSHFETVVRPMQIRYRELKKK